MGITRRSSVAVGIFITLLVVAMALPADAKKNHTSNTYTNNGCPWVGYHNWGSGYAEAYTTHFDGTGLFCTEMQVKLRVNGYTYIDNDADYAAYQISANIYSFSWTDHNANPSGPPPWVGFRMT